MRTRSRTLAAAKPSATSTSAVDTNLSPEKFAFAATRIATAQIVHSTGYKSAQSSALNTLTDAAGKYLGALAESSAASASSGGRTQCNLFDVVKALETLSSVQGFAGGSNLNRPILSSSTLVELSQFVKFSLEMPFAQAIRRQNPPDSTVWQLTGERYGHIPRWLPAVPHIEREAAIGRERGLYGCLASDKTKDQFFENEGVNLEERKGIRVDLVKDEKMRIGLPKKRGRVRFKMGMREGGLGVGLRNGVCRPRKRVLCDNRFDNKEEDDDVHKRGKKMKLNGKSQRPVICYVRRRNKKTK